MQPVRRTRGTIIACLVSVYDMPALLVIMPPAAHIIVFVFLPIYNILFIYIAVYVNVFSHPNDLFEFGLCVTHMHLSLK